ncbi:hypothetical protein GM921_13940 [Pedobacter sp. LMG 31464]|uniref:Uncharacterized protein n=2 Tax=Pedobacter planticolens TaxID=2679964 RepID=A0A923DYV4_9SPHI|nr:hypothetical protein [Pedobacter planticolens]
MFLLLFNLQKVNAQAKRDTIYYLLDTAKVPIKDRMFRIESEGPFMFYSLECKCFPYGYGIGFYYQIADKKEKRISFQKFRQLKTVSVMQLIDLALKCLPPENRNKYQFIFAEPEGDKIRLTEMMLWIPLKPRKTITVETIGPIRN